MKKFLAFPIFLLLTAFAIYFSSPSIPGCNTYTTSSVISRSGMSNITISDLYINASGYAYGIQLTNCTNVHITRVKIVGAITTSYSGAITLKNCKNIYIDTCYIANSTYGVIAQNCGDGVTANIRVIYNRFYNIHSDSTKNGDGTPVQFNNCNGAGMRIDSNMMWQPFPNPGIGDQISVYQCNGTATSYIRVYYNSILGGSTNSSMKSGTVLGDVGGAYQDAEYNSYVNAGAQGMQVQGGTNIIIANNSIYGYKVPNSVVGISFGNYSGFPCNNITIASNKINFTRPNNNVYNTWIDPTSYANGVSGAPLATPAGYSSNTPQTIADGSITVSLLPNPLWGSCSVPVLSPPNISYSGTPYTFTYGSAIANQIPVNIGGAAASYSASLPPGLSINTTSGVIAGTPTAASSSTSYAIIATNTAGHDTTHIIITVNKVNLTIIANNLYKAYNTANPTLTIDYIGFVLSDNNTNLLTQPSISTTAITSSPPGPYPITTSGGSSNNYNLFYQAGTLTVETASVNLLIRGYKTVITSY